VLQKNKLNPLTTLFIDDTLKHVEGARKLGIVAELFPQNQLLKDYFKDANLY
jgi:FMN phosphatase YigB (HAD superfamily)